MYNPGMLHLLVKMKRDSLIQEAEQQRLVNLALRKKPGDQGMGLKFFKSFRKSSVADDERLILALEASMSNTCRPEQNS